MLRRLAAFVALFWALPVFAQEKPESPREPVTIYISHVQQLERLSDDHKGKAFALLGRVTIEVARVFRIRAQRSVIWLDPDTDATIFNLVEELDKKEGRGIPLWAVRAIYAEGGRVPAIFQSGGQTFRCTSFFYDFTTQRGVFLDASLRLRQSGDREDFPDLVLRARKLRATRPGEWRARDVRFFSSNYHDHEVAIEVQRVVLRDPKMRSALGRLTRISAKGHRDGKGATEEEVRAVADELADAAPAIASKRMTLTGLTARAWGVPFFKWRDLDVKGEDLLPLRVEVDVGSQGLLGSGAYLGIGLSTKPVGFLIGGGYYQRRGPLADLHIDVEGALDGRLSGATVVAYIDDRSGDAPTERRYWFQNRYRYEISDRWRVQGELTLLSDLEWLRIYDEREFKEGKDQETVLSFRYRGDRGYLAFTGKEQTMDFLPTLEELPRFEAELPVLTLLQLGESARGEPITLQLATRFEVGNLRFRQGDLRLLPDFRTTRVDLEPTFFVSFDVGPLRVVPFGTFRVTGYDRALDGDAEGRFAGSAGVRVDLQLARTYLRVRHIVNLSLEYEDVYTVTVDRTELFPLDAVDGVTNVEGLSFRWRNRLLRARKGAVEEFLSFEVHVGWFFDRDFPAGLQGDLFVDLDFEWLVTPDVRLSARADIDAEEGKLATGSVEAWWAARRRLWLRAGLRHLDEDSDTLTASAEFEVDRRWWLVLFSQVDLRDTEALDQGFLVQRLGKTAVVGLRFSYDPGGGDFSFSVKLDVLHAFRRKQQRRHEDLRRTIGWR